MAKGRQGMQKAVCRWWCVWQEVEGGRQRRQGKACGYIGKAGRHAEGVGQARWGRQGEGR